MAEHSPRGRGPCDRSSLSLPRPGVYNRLHCPFRITSLQSDRRNNNDLLYRDCTCVRDTVVTVATNNNNNNNNNGCSIMLHAPSMSLQHSPPLDTTQNPLHPSPIVALYLIRGNYLMRQLSITTSCRLAAHSAARPPTRAGDLRREETNESCLIK